MYSKKNEIVVGLIVAIAIIILIVGNILFTGSKMRAEKYNVTIIFPRIGGLEIGNPVFVKGVRKGKVSHIDLIDKGVEVNISLSKDAKLFTDAKFFITEVGMMGEKQMEIYPGNANQVLDTSQKIQGEYMPGLGEIFAEVRKTVKNINKLSEQLENFLQNHENRQEIAELIKNLNNLSKNLSDFSDEKGKFTANFDRISEVAELMDTLIIESKGKIGRIITSTDNQLYEVEAILCQLKDITKRLNDKHTDFGHFTSSDSLYNNLNQAVKNLDSLVIDIKKNPKRYFKVF
jgi:phospholipid/cholesterol/gamma-HCH transport system substrate-binding protein